MIICCSGLITHLRFPLKLLALAMEYVLTRAFLHDFLCLLTPSVFLEPSSYPFHLTLFVKLAYFFSNGVATISVSLFHHKVFLFPTHQKIVWCFLACFSLTFISSCMKNLSICHCLVCFQEKLFLLMSN